MSALSPLSALSEAPAVPDVAAEDSGVEVLDGSDSDHSKRNSPNINANRDENNISSAVDSQHNHIGQDNAAFTGDLESSNDDYQKAVWRASYASNRDSTNYDVPPGEHKDYVNSSQQPNSQEQTDNDGDDDKEVESIYSRVSLRRDGSRRLPVTSDHSSGSVGTPPPLPPPLHSVTGEEETGEEETPEVSTYL